MASKSKAKGSRFEYTIRDMLNKIYDTKEFARTPGSGSIMGRSNFAKREGMSDAAKDTLSADLICPSWFPYSIEAKNYADKPTYPTIIHSYDATLDGWLGEALFDAINFNKIPMLFFNTTRKGSFIAVPEIIAKHLKLGNYLVYRDFRIIGMAAFADNADVFKVKGTELLTEVIAWMGSSPHGKELLAMQDAKAAKPKPKRVKKIVDTNPAS